MFLFSGEDIFLICQRKSLRISKDWVGNQWVEIQAKLDILSVISLVRPQAKLTSCSVLAKGAESGSSVMSDRGAMATHANSNDEDMQMETSLNRRNDDDLLENTKQCVDTKTRPDIVSALTSAPPCLKLTSRSIVTKGIESDSSTKLDSGGIAAQVTSNDEDKQIGTSLSRSEDDASPENAEQFISRKRQREEGDEEDCDTKVVIDGDNS